LRQDTLRLFGEQEDAFHEVLEHACNMMEGIKYAFPNEDSLKRVYELDLQLGEALYIFNLLQNCHLAACVSLLRAHRWLEGVRHGINAGNFFIFSSSFRGFIESTADSYDVMRYIGKTLELNFVPYTYTLFMKKTLEGEILIHDTRQFNEVLNHFIYARKLSHAFIAKKLKGMSDTEAENYKKVHVAKEPWEYRGILKEQGFTQIDKVYSELSETTHASSSSVFLFLRRNEDGTFNLTTDRDDDKIAEFIRKYGKDMRDFLSVAITPSLLALKTINEFPIHDEPYKSLCPSVLKLEEIANSINLDSVEAWTHTKKAIERKKLEFIV